MYRIKNIIFLWALYFILIASVVYAEKFEQYILDNGLKIIIKEDHCNPMVALQVWYKIGDDYNNQYTSHISALLQQLVLNVNNNPHVEYLKKVIFANGDKYEASNDLYYSVYKHLAPATELENILELESFRMSNVVLNDENIFNKEKHHFLIKTIFNNHINKSEVALKKFYDTAYGYQSIQPNHIEVLQLSELNNWYKNWYNPNNAVIILVGAINIDKSLQLIKRYFGVLTKHNNHLTVLDKELLNHELGYRRLEVKMPINFPYLLVGYNVPSLNTAKHDWEPFAIEILVNLLKQYLINHGKLLTTVCDVEYNPFGKQSSLAYLSLIPLNSQNFTIIEDIIWQQIEQLQSNTVVDIELATIKNKILTNHMYTQQSLFKQITTIGKLEIAGYNFGLLEQYPKEIKRITAKQVQAVAKKYFIKEHLTVARILPEGS